MLPTSLAIGWGLWREHRWGLVAGIAYYLLAATLSALLPAYFKDFAPNISAAIAFGLAVPVLWLSIFLIGIGSFGLAVDVGSGQSCFPSRLFTLPVRTGALAGWPLAYGALGASLLWLATAGLILQPWLRCFESAVPLWWPMLVAAATVAWCQALLWLPFGLPWVRVILFIPMCAGVITAATSGADANLSEWLLAGLFAGATAIGWLVAYLGVRAARRGDVPNWEALLRPLHWVARQLPERRRRFQTAERAQVWFEWRRTGNSLPIMTGAILPFVLLPLAFGINDAIPIENTLLTALAVPVFFAGMSGITVSGKNPWAKDYYGLSPFTATTPMTTAAMVAAKLKAAMWSTLAAWAIVAIVTPAALVLFGSVEEAPDWWRQALRQFSPIKFVAGIAACSALLLIWTWKRQADSLLLGLTGRKWLIQGTLFLWMTGFFALLGLGVWIYHHPESHKICLAVLPWFLGVMVMCRLFAAGWALRQSLRKRLMAPRLAKRWMMTWLLLALALFSMLAWSVPAALVPAYYLAFVVLLALPMASLAATPLALAWNRHR